MHSLRAALLLLGDDVVGDGVDHLLDIAHDRCMKTFPNDISVMLSIAHLSRQVPLQPDT